MDDATEIDRLHDHWHELRKAVDTTGITVAVIQERQKGIGEQMARIEGSVSVCVDLLQQQNGRLRDVEQLAGRLDERMPSSSDERNPSSSKAGGIWGGATGALGGLLAGFMSGWLGGK